MHALRIKTNGFGCNLIKYRPYNKNNSFCTNQVPQLSTFAYINYMKLNNNKIKRKINWFDKTKNGVMTKICYKDYYVQSELQIRSHIAAVLFNNCDYLLTDLKLNQ